MKPGSVIVDLAGEAGGNCELTQPGGDLRDRQRRDDRRAAEPAVEMAEHASQLYARNVASLLELMTGEDGALELDFEDEIIAGACITRGGEIVHEGAKRAAEGVDGPADRAGDPRAGRVRRLRGHLEGAEHAAHAADVGTNAIHGIVVLGGML